MRERFRLRRSEGPDPGDDEEWPDDEGPPAAPARATMGVAPGAEAGDDLPPSRLRGNEIAYGYAVGGIIAVASVVMLVVTTGKGAPRHPQPIWPALGAVFGVATMLSIRFSNRLVTSMTAIVGGFVAGQARTPNSLSGIRLVALLAPVLYGIMLFRRQTKADRARRADRDRTTPARAGGDRRRGRRGAAAEDEATPSGPKASARYTPPKSRTPPPKGPRARR